MLAKWQSHKFAKQSEFNPREYGFSELDDEEMIQALLENDIDFEMIKSTPRSKPKPKLLTKDAESVKWATETVYSDKKGITFISDWEKSLNDLAGTIEYRSIQLQNAYPLHHRAMKLFEHFRMTQIRSYLFFFDIIVEHGGFYAAVVGEFRRGVQKTPNADETLRLQTILKIRVKYTKRRFMADVKSRKNAIINGSGVVHGHARNFDTEFCTNLKATLSPTISQAE